MKVVTMITFLIKILEAWQEMIIILNRKFYVKELYPKSGSILALTNSIGEAK
jgi:hypothetical protein